MAQSGDGVQPPEGLRERKRRETATRIKEAGIRLFIEKGYAATTGSSAASASAARVGNSMLSSSILMAPHE
mgnify:CR=1 FL=1